MSSTITDLSQIARDTLQELGIELHRIRYGIVHMGDQEGGAYAPTTAEAVEAAVKAAGSGTTAERFETFHDTLAEHTPAMTISITQDGVWAGDGVLREGRIEDCAAALGPSRGGNKTDDIEGAYEAIERAIARGEYSTEHDGVEYTWEIVEDDDR